MKTEIRNFHAIRSLASLFLHVTAFLILFYAANAVAANAPAQIPLFLGNGSSGSVGTNSTQLNTGTRIYQAEFFSSDWHGDLVSLAFDAATQTTITKWDIAGDGLLPENPANSDIFRNIFTFNDQSGAGGRYFTADSTNGVTSLQQAALTPTTSLCPSGSSSCTDTWDTRLAWLRGRTDSIYRSRNSETVLGDIIDSTPLYVGNNNFGYAGLVDQYGTPLVPGESSYGEYLTSKEGGTGLVFVGANDGMLHAFNASSGNEVFAYVPEAVFPNLDSLADPSYQHHYYVDGSPTVGDACLSQNNRFNNCWHTFVVGTLGAGGKGVFGLDVTSLLGYQPNSIPTPTPDIVKWDFSSSIAMGDYGSSAYGAPFSFSDLGYTIPKADIALVNCSDSICSDAVDNKVWAAIVPNGYDSASGTAALFILDLSNGKVIREINVGGAGNGLSGAVPVDINGDRTTDYIYAGDLNGNLWKFDVTNPNPAYWSAVDLFKATDSNNNPQSITSTPTIGTDGQGGLLIYFGTGAYFRSANPDDRTTTQIQTFYAVRDADVVSGAGNGNTKTLSRSDLLQQDFFTGTQTIGTNQVRVSTANTIDFSKDSGWYIDLTGATASGAPSERVISSPSLDNGRIVFDTMIPDSSSSSGGESYLVELNAISGSRLNYTPLDLNSDRQFSSADYASVTTTDSSGSTVTTQVPISAIKWGIGIVRNQAIVGKGNAQYKFAAGTASTALKVQYENAGTQSGRLSWRQLR